MNIINIKKEIPKGLPDEMRLGEFVIRCAMGWTAKMLQEEYGYSVGTIYSYKSRLKKHIRREQNYIEWYIDIPLVEALRKDGKITSEISEILGIDEEYVAAIPDPELISENI